MTKEWMHLELLTRRGKQDQKSDCMKLTICAVLAVGMLCSLVGCQKGSLPKPPFPLEKDVISATLEQLSLPWILSESETQSNLEGQIAYTLRDQTETYGDTENKVLRANISSTLIEGERTLQMFFGAVPVQEKPSFAWENWKQQIVFSTLLYGGFENEEALYRALSNQKMPETKKMEGEAAPAGAETLEWDVKIPGAYCRIRYQLYGSKVIHTFPSPVIEAWNSSLTVVFYESEAVYHKNRQNAMDRIKTLQRERAETPN